VNLQSGNREIRTFIVDDEPLARRGLELRLVDEPDIRIVAQYDGASAMKGVSEHLPDLMFLDVQMPGLDGFETLRAIPAPQMPLIVFVTAYDHYAIRAFEASAVDYLLKPVDESRLHQALYRVRQTLGQQEAKQHCERLLRLLGDLSGKPELSLTEALTDAAQPRLGPRDRIAIKDGARTLRIELATVRWIDAAGDYMCIHTDADTYILRATMRELEDRLDPRHFPRVHRSALINAARVVSMRPHSNGELFLALDCGNEVKLSRSYRDRIQFLR
jgi:two-component system, LytTR family, response regulator